SSRRRHTRWPRDWSSDVCSSDLPVFLALRIHGSGTPAYISTLMDVIQRGKDMRANGMIGITDRHGDVEDRLKGLARVEPLGFPRSEERRVGKEGGVRWWGEA